MVETSGKCEICSKLSTLRCSYCRLVYYCDAKHQKRDWKRHKPFCTQPKFKVAENEAIGRYLVATEILKHDQIVLKDKAIIIGLKLDSSDNEGQRSNILFCLGCYKDLRECDTDDPECTRCSLPICSESCSGVYWHSNFECRFFSESKFGSDETEKVYHSVTVIRWLLYFRALLLKCFNAEKFSCLATLPSNSSLREDLPSLEKTTRVFDDFKKMLTHAQHPLVTIDLSKPELHQLIGIVDTNGIDIQVSETVTLTGIYATAALIEHSCFPNTRVYFVPKVSANTRLTSIDLYARAAARIEHGQHVTTSKTNLLWNTEKRLKDLKEKKFLTCTCSRCTDPTELGTNFSTLRCQVTDCTGWSVPVPKPGTDTLQWECQLCQKVTEGWQVAKVDKRLAEMVSRLKSEVDPYREMLRAMDTLVHPNYYLNFIVNHSLIQLYGKTDTTRNDKTVLDEKIRICNQLLGVLKVIDPGLASLNLYAAVVYYEMQAAILALAGGEGEDDFKILRSNPESVKLAKIYLDRALKCFEYEFFALPENKLRILVEKKMEYLNMVVKHSRK